MHAIPPQIAGNPLTISWWRTGREKPLSFRQPPPSVPEKALDFQNGRWRLSAAGAWHCGRCGHHGPAMISARAGSAASAVTRQVIQVAPRPGLACGRCGRRLESAVREDQILPRLAALAMPRSTCWSGMTPFAA